MTIQLILSLGLIGISITLFYVSHKYGKKKDAK